MKNFLSIENLSKTQIEQLVDDAIRLKAERGTHEKPLAGQTWALIFTKSSTRTRVSFEVGIRELGGNVMFLSDRDMQLGRGEPIKDTARVMGRMVHGAVIRTGPQSYVEDFAQFSNIPTVNALTDEEHPCQIIADLQTMKETIGGWEGKKVCYIGDGDCNVPRSWMWAAAKLGFELVIAAPESYQPPADFREKLNAPNITFETDPIKAATGADALYTDVWISMGKEEEAAERVAALGGYQINDELLAVTNKDAIVMHCLPAYRGKEITEEALEAHADTIFQEAENRLHAQKAILCSLI
jgi:ornithine carbamoyltransferase